MDLICNVSSANLSSLRRNREPAPSHGKDRDTGIYIQRLVRGHNLESNVFDTSGQSTDPIYGKRGRRLCLRGQKFNIPACTSQRIWRVHSYQCVFQTRSHEWGDGYNCPRAKSEEFVIVWNLFWTGYLHLSKPLLNRFSSSMLNFSPSPSSEKSFFNS